MPFSTLLTVLIGAVLAGQQFGLIGAVIGAVLGYLLTTTLQLHRRVAQLESRLSAPAASQAAAQPEEPTIAPVVTPVTPVTRKPASIPSPLPPPPAPSIRQAQPGSSGQTFQRLRAFVTGGNLPVRLGVIVLFFGVAFLLKYAAENARLPIELRLSAVALGGIALLVAGWRLRSRRTGFGLALQGGGIGVLYLTAFTGMRLYQLLPPQAAFALLILLVVFSSLLAVLQNSAALATLATIGGFLAPVLTSSGDGNHVLLFSYYTLLNAGVFGIAYFRAWRALNVVGFLFTFVIGTAWGIEAYRPELFASTEPFLLLFFLMYVGIAVLFALRQPPQLRGYIDGTLVFGTPIAAFGLQVTLVQGMPHALAWSAIAAGGLYIALARLLWRHTSPARPLAEAFLALGLVFATVAVPLALTGSWTAGTWALEGAVLVWVGVRQQRLLARLSGLLLQLAAGMALLWQNATTLYQPSIFSSSLLAGLCLALAGLFSAWFLQQHRERLRDWERDLYVLPFLWGLLWWAGSLYAEIMNRMPPDWLLTALILATAASALLALAVGERTRWRLLRYTALVLLPLMALFALASVENSPHPLADGGWIAWPAALATHLWLLFRLEKELTEQTGIFYHAAGVWLVALLGSFECAYWLDRAALGADTWPLAGWALAPLGLLVWLARLPARHWPFTRHAHAYSRLGLIPVVAALGLWLVFANLTSRGHAAPLPYMPFLNPLDLTQAMVLLAAIRWWRRLSPPLFDHRFAAALLGSIIFLWLNAILVRSVHHWGGVDFAMGPMLASTILQTGLSLLWCVMALICMHFARRWHVREIWFIGAMLIAAVIVKLFLIDLDGSNTLSRIVSFLGVGLLLMLIGYLSPLPPPARSSEPLT